MPPWTIKEHHARYELCRGMVAGKDVVDCACGSGELSSILRSAGARSVIGVDVDADAIESAKAHFSAKGITFICSDGQKLPLPNDACDVFVSLETLEHVGPDQEFVNEMHRVLRKGGLLVCSTPNRVITNPMTTIFQKPWNPFHVREYSRLELESLISQRFIIEKQFGQNPASWLRVKFVNIIASWLGTPCAIKVNQLWKCRWFVFDSSQAHHVREMADAYFEYFVFIARK